MMIALSLLVLCAPNAAADSRNARDAAPIYLVMDVSGSMEGERLAAARAAARAFIAGLQPDQIMALYTFPGGRKVVDGCPAGQFNIRPQRIDAGNAQFAINLLSAGGNTPTVPALKEIMRNVVNNGYEYAQVVLVTDGEANCGDSSDVCTIVPLLTQQGINLRIHTVSLNNTPTGDASLACLARATGGTATTAGDTDALIEAVRRSSSYAATLGVDVPDSLPRVTGRAKDLAPTMTVTVNGVGTALLPDASLVVTFSSGSAARRVEIDPSGLVTLGNVDVGATVVRHLTLYPMATADGPITWTVSLISGGTPIATSTGNVSMTSGSSVDSAGSILRDAKHVVVLGDSYSSGEGGGSYDGSGDSRVGNCHRSAKGYGRVLYPDAQIVACSGAVTADLTHFNVKDSFTNWVEPQLYQLLQLVASDSPPDLVFMTLGGNDVGFADVVSGFVFSSTADDAPAVRPAVEWATVQSRLVTSYAHVNAVVNSAAAIAKRGGKIAQLVILPYVRPIPKFGGDGCFVLVSHHELDLANDFLTSLNKTVKKAVDQSAGDGVPVQLASPVEYAMQPDHTICDGSDTWAKVIRSDNVWPAIPGDKRQELMHPNPDGYAAVAASIVEWSRTVTPRTLGKDPLDYRSIDVRLYSDSNVSWDKRTKLGDTGIVINLPGVVTEPGQSVSADLCVEQCEFGSVVVTVTSMSQPVPLGTLPVSPTTGRPTGTIVLPDELEPGVHTLVLRGYNVDGSPHEARFAVMVWRPGANLGIYLIGLGTMLLLACAGLLLVGHTKRARKG